MKKGLVSLLFSCFALMIAWADGRIYAPQSALSEGKWMKVRVEETGIYKLTYTDLRKMGFPDPEKVSVHGYGGWILDEDFSKPYIDDLPATAVWRGNDYLLFYAKGPVKWLYGEKTYISGTPGTTQFFHENNPYSSYGYYFITDATPVKDMDSVASISNVASAQISTFDDYALYEKEQVSVNHSGRELFGESFESNTSQTFSFAIPGITGDEGRISFRFISKAVDTSGSVTLGIDGEEMITGSIRIDNNSYTNGIALHRTTTWIGTKSENPRVTVAYNPAGHKSHLDYICLQMKRELKSYAQNGTPYTFFRSISARRNVSMFTIRDATSNMLVFDVTDAVNPVRMETSFDGSNLSFTIPVSETLREFALVDLSKTFKTPETVGLIANQNLHALPQTDMVILAPPAFTGEANRLAAYHREKNPNVGSVTIVTPDQIFNEFSSGTPDATAIRRFMKMFYDRRTSGADAPKFLLLFGAGSYDNRRLTDVWKKTPTENFILTYQSHNSLNSGSYVMDDYFGFLADNSGGANYITDDILLGIGRFPVQTVSQAKNAVDKVIAYMDNQTTGIWKNNLTFLADDGSTLDTPPYDTIHMKQSNDLSEGLERKYPEFLSNKLFFDAYKKSSTGGRTSYPDIEAGLQRQLKEGTFLLNYTGHGNKTSLSDEQVITSAEIRQATYPFLPLWITATCDFTPFDNIETSA
ncbi:MAG: type IX secretion system sortase PorU, partial [Tannerella sp.]|nr:type IX secretion system sortase PorU [Tannerella sp.]